MRIYTGKKLGRTYVLTIKSAAERIKRDPLTGDAIKTNYHEAELTLAVDNIVVDMFSREFRVWDEDRNMTDVVANFIKKDMLDRATSYYGR